ncbi:MAG: aminotransferase class IV [Halanaeroarchaeum sp.]
MSGLQYHVDGELVRSDEATVSVEDRGFRYGDGAFETLRAYGGTTFEWEAHEDRLRRTCETLGMAGAVPGDLRERVRETLAANDLQEAYVRVSVTRGPQSGKLMPDPEVDPTVVVVVKRLRRGGVEGDPVWATPAVVETVETRRIPDESIPADAKTHNYLNGILARLELQQGSERIPDEALLRDTDGFLAEGATSNLFFVEDGTLKTPSTDGPVLPGITRSVVLDLARAEAFPVEVGRYRPAALAHADEVFLTNTTWEIRPVAEVDGHEIGGGPITELLSRLFDERVEREHYGE